MVANHSLVRKLGAFHLIPSEIAGLAPRIMARTASNSSLRGCFNARMKSSTSFAPDSVRAAFLTAAFFAVVMANCWARSAKCIATGCLEASLLPGDIQPDEALLRRGHRRSTWPRGLRQLLESGRAEWLSRVSYGGGGWNIVGRAAQAGVLGGRVDIDRAILKGDPHCLITSRLDDLPRAIGPVQG